MAELTCTGLAKSYGSRPVLADVDLAVPEGTLTAILGASGSGKTTLLRLVIGFVPLDRGVISVGGTVVAETPGSVGRVTGLGFDSVRLLPLLDAAERPRLLKRSTPWGTWGRFATCPKKAGCKPAPRSLSQGTI